MKHFLFVCTGNTCRSPMAEAVLRHISKDSNDILVKSAGLFAMSGNPANEKAITVLNEKGISISHQSQPLTTSLIDWANAVLTMTMDHKQAIIQQYPGYTNKVFTLKEYVQMMEKKEDGKDFDIPDPFGSSIHQYRDTFDEIYNNIQKLYENKSDD